MKERLILMVGFALSVVLLVSCGNISTVPTTQTQEITEQTTSDSTEQASMEPSENESADTGSTAPPGLPEEAQVITGQTTADSTEQASVNPTENEPLNIGSTATPSSSEGAADENGSALVGLITSDVLYRGISISQLLGERPEDIISILGEPNPADNECGPLYFYDDMQISYYDYVADIGFMDLSLFEIDGVSLDKNREELVSAFGNPVDYYEYRPWDIYRDDEDNRMMRYHVTGHVVDYILEFWFGNPNDKAYYCSAYNYAPNRFGQ